MFSDVPHQICEFHVLKELTKAILRAVAKVRKTLAGRKPTGKRGRPSTPAAKRAVRQRQRLQQKIADLFEHRHLFVQHDLTPAQRRSLRSITSWIAAVADIAGTHGGSLPPVRSPLPHRHGVGKTGQTASAGPTIQAGRQSVEQTSVPQPGQGADVFLDDKLLPSTSNAVERGNRRHRKMQKTVYRVRTQGHIHNRIAMDMVRDSQKEGRTATITLLHKKRAG